VAKINTSPGVREGIHSMKKPNKNKGKSYVDIMKEAGEKYGVKVTDMSEQGVRAIGLLGGVRWPKRAALPGRRETKMNMSKPASNTLGKS
jgi:hypothetical protein